MTRRRNLDPTPDLFYKPPLDMVEPLTRPKPVMPDRGYTYSEDHRKACELRQLHAWHKTMLTSQWRALWEQIARHRGQSCARELGWSYGAFLESMKHDQAGDGSDMSS